MTYPIIEIPDNAPELPEQQGTKQKYWIHHNKNHFLLKIGRSGTGENWAEKVTCELAELMGLPHAYYDLAIWKGQKGIISENFVPNDGRLITGNELLSEIHHTYRADSRYKAHEHTIRRIIAYLGNSDIELPLNWQVPTPIIENVLDVFLGYLLFDAWIANQDRHHENWGVLSYDDKIYLAPTYDHAASLGQNQLDSNRVEMLNTKDKGRHISHFVTKARSAIYETKTAKKTMLSIDAFRFLAKRRKKAAQFWLEQLTTITPEQCTAIFEQIPKTEISEIAIKFALTLLELNKKRLLEVTP
jgi:hypothetical protein